MSDDYYLGSFSSLKHNILLMLNQIDGNAFDAGTKGVLVMPFLVQIQRRLDEIIKKYDALQEKGD